MRKNNIFAIGLLCFSLFCVTACGESNSTNNNNNNNSTNIGYVKDEQYKLYEADLASGKFTGSYEDWLIQTYKDKVQSIESIVKTKTEGLIDTYTITFSNNSTTTFTVTNGKDGIDGIKGEKGEDGHTPVIKIGDNGNWFIDDIDTNVKAAGIDGKPGVNGKSAYELYKEAHPEYTGTLEEWLNSLKGENGNDGSDGINGKSAYELYKEAHPEYKGTLEEWLASLKGNDGQDGQPGADGQDGKPGKPGVDGKSAYELYKEAHPEYTGTLEEWLESLKGTSGKPGVDGKSAYEIYKKHYLKTNNVEYTKTEEEWLDDLVNDRLGTIVKHNVMFDEQGGSLVDDQEVEHLSKVSKPIDPVKEGYTFDGWYVGDEKWVFNGYNVTDNITLTAHWSIIECKLNITINDDELINTTYKYGDVIDMLDLCVIFDNDYVITDEVGNVVPNKFIIRDDMNINLNNKYAYFKYSDNDVRKINIKELQTLSDLEKPVKEGFTFKSWYTMSEDGEWHIPNDSYIGYYEIIGHTLYPQFVLTNDLYKYNMLNNEIYITEVANSNVVEIPETIDGKPVVSVSLDNTCTYNIDKLIIGKNIKKLNISLFESTINNIYYDGTISEWLNLNIGGIISSSNLYLKDDKNSYYLLENLVIPNGVTEIKDFSFDTIQSIKSIKIPNTVKRIGKYAFDTTNITEIEIPGSVEIIEHDAFSYCPNLQKIKLNEGLKYIGESAFASDNNQYELVNIPSTVEYLGADAFYFNIKKRPINMKECNQILYRMDSISFISEGFEIINQNVLNNSDLYYIPKSIKEIKSQKIYNYNIFLYEGSKEDFLKIKLEDKNQFKFSKIIYNINFNNFTEYTTENYKYIENENNEIIIQAIINNNIKKDLINDFPNKKVIGCLSENLPYNDGLYITNSIKFMPIVDHTSYIDKKVYFDGTLEEYLDIVNIYSYMPKPIDLYLKENGKYKKVENIVIPNGTKRIENGSLLINCKSILLPDSIEYIGDNAIFSNQTNLRLPEKLEYLGYNAIYSEDVKKIYIGKDLKLTNGNPFNCHGLNEIDVDENNEFYKSINHTSLINIKNNSLISCINIKDIPDVIRIFEFGCFDLCGCIDYFVFPKSTKIIEDIPCTNVISVPFGVESINFNQNINVFYEGGENDWNSLNIYSSDKANLIYESEIQKVDTVYDNDYIYQIINEKYINNINLVSNKSTIDLSKCFDNYEIINFDINDFRTPNLKKLIIPCSAKNVQLVYDNNPKFEVYLDSDTINPTWIQSWHGYHKFYLRSEWEYDSNGEPMPK